jgi:uridine kinase
VHAQVVVVAGPSGSGKSVLCGRLQRAMGVPVVNLDDFYKDGDDPTLPMVHLPGGAPIVDWDDPRSWSHDEAVAALVELCTKGLADIPVYDIAHDGRVGQRTVSVAVPGFMLVEGIFADQVVPALGSRDLLAEAVCLRNPPVVTFFRRLVRDLREGRKPPWVLIRRGLALVKAEPAIVERARAAGCRVMTSKDAFVMVRDRVTG